MVKSDLPFPTDFRCGYCHKICSLEDGMTPLLCDVGSDARVVEFCQGCVSKVCVEQHQIHITACSSGEV